MKKVKCFCILSILFFNLHNSFSQESWRVKRLKEDSLELNKLVLVAIHSEKGSAERRFIRENIKKRFPNFIDSYSSDIFSDSLLINLILNSTNRQYGYNIKIQQLNDERIQNYLELRKLYENKGFELTQANVLVLQRGIIPNCFNNKSNKEGVDCTKDIFSQYLEELNLFSSIEIQSLVEHVEKQLWSELRPKSPKKTHTSTPLKKKN